MCNKMRVATLSVGFMLCGVAIADETPQKVDVAPQQAPASQVSGTPSKVFSESDFVFRSVPGKTLTSMRMHPAANPDEAALRCNVMEPCIMGLSRGFGVGGDAVGMLSSLVYQPQAQAGAWLLTDVFATYQFVDAVEKMFNANGSIGYRAFRYEDSNGNVQKAGGVSWRLNYAQDITQEYTQGLIFSGMLSSWNSVEPESRIYRSPLSDATSNNARRALRDFYEYSHHYPTLWVSFPADVEVINWKANHIDLPNDLRGYGHIEPFFAQNEFKLPNNAFQWVEQNFGVRTAATLAYESRAERVAGRFSIQATVGLEFATSSHEVDAPAAAQDVSFDLPAREPVSPYGDLGVTWQF